MEEKKTELKMIKMSEVQSQEIEWLWYPFIPYGKLTIVQGDPGDGKTTLILNIAAKLSKGEGMDNDMKLMESMNIIYQTAEDGLADTVKPRLEKAGADCERILIIDESDKSLSMADDRLEEAIIQTGARMLILDPIQAYLGGGIDMNRANEARDMTKRLGALAEKYKCAIILIGHMNKASGSKSTYRGLGSIDIQATARSVLLVARLRDKPNIRIMAHDKSSLAPAGDAIGFEMTEDNGMVCIGPYDITIDELLSGNEGRGKKKLDIAENFIKEYFGSNKVIPSNEIMMEAAKRSIKRNTLLSAKKKLGITSDKEKAEDLLQALMGEQLAWALEDRMEIAHQVNILRESQGGKYVPFISAELGKALKLKLESSTSLQSIVRNLTGGSTTNIFAQFNQQNNVTQQNAITVEEARQIVLESQRVLDKPEEAKLLEDRYDIKSLPEVVATKQEGVDTSKEGLNLNKAELMQITDDYKGAMSSFSKEHHELRREIEMRIDPDEEDPELYQYEDFEEEEKEDGSFASQFLRNSKLP